MDGVGIILFVIVGLLGLYAVNLIIAGLIKAGTSIDHAALRVGLRWLNLIIIAFLASFTVFAITQNEVVSGLALFLIIIQGCIPERKKER